MIETTAVHTATHPSTKITCAEFYTPRERFANIRETSNLLFLSSLAPRHLRLSSSINTIEPLLPLPRG